MRVDDPHTMANGLVYLWLLGPRSPPISYNTLPKPVGRDLGEVTRRNLSHAAHPPSLVLRLPDASAMRARGQKFSLEEHGEKEGGSLQVIRPARSRAGILSPKYREEHRGKTAGRGEATKKSSFWY